MRNRLKVLRAERDWTQEELAKRVGISRQAIHSIETGKYDPSLPLGMRLARLFGRAVEDVFQLEDPVLGIAQGDLVKRCAWVVVALVVAGSAAGAHQQAPPPRSAPGSLPTMTADLGYWLGILRVGVKDLRMLLFIETSPDGSLRATLTSLDQAMTAHSSSRAAMIDGELQLEFGSISLRLKRAAPNRLSGTFSQHGAIFPLNLDRSDGIPTPKRPQLPDRPVPYDEEEVTFLSPKAGITLAGTLSRPRGDRAAPAVVLISGSGPQDRDETLFGHKPFLVIADALTRRGIAVLRVDDRGVGGSTGSRETATSEDYADDALAAVSYLKSRPDIQASQIGLVGHSEGGLIAPLAATRAEVAFIVLLAAPGLTGADLSRLQAATMQKAAGVSGDVLEFNLRLQKRVLAALVAHTSEPVIRAEVEKILQEELAAIGVTSAEVMAQLRKQIEPEIRRGLRPWSRYFMLHDPVPVLRIVKCPVLVLNGDRDTQVPAAENTKAIADALKAGGNTDHAVMVLPGLNHLFQTAPTGAVSEYAVLEETFAPAALTVLGDWIVARTGRR